MFFHSPPTYHHLKCFGCLCFVSTLPHNRNKFAPRARKCVFLGYPYGIKGYKVLDLESNSVYISIDVIFYVTSSQPSTSYLDDFVFPLCTSDYTEPSSPSFPNISANISIVVPNATSAIPADPIATTSCQLSTFYLDDFVFPLCTSDYIEHSSPSFPNIPTNISIAVPDATFAISVDPIATTPAIYANPVVSTDINSLSEPIISDSLNPSSSSPSLPVLRRSTRPHNPPPYLSNYACQSVSTKLGSGLPYDVSASLDYSHLGPAFHFFVMVVTNTPSEPVSFHQAVQFPEWRATMDKEIEALEINDTWTLTPLPPGKTPIGCKWVYRIKYLPDGIIERYKACLVAKGFTQKLSLDYSETFSLVAKSVSIRIVLSLAAVKGWFLHQMDVNNAFLHGDLVENVYMCLAPSFHSKGEKNLVCKLNKSLYGLKQASRQWFDKFSNTIMQMGLYNLSQTIICSLTLKGLLS